MRKLAADIGMSEVNLHRCVNNNKMQASDLEKIASLLGVDIGVFFGVERERVTKAGNSISQSGNNTGNASISDTSTTDRAIEEMTAQRAMYERQIDRLLAIVEAVTGCANTGQRK